MATEPIDRPRSFKYAFTITLKPWLYKYTPSRQIADSVDVVKSGLAALGHSTLLWELTKASNIHYHGVIEMYTQSLTLQRIKNLHLRWNNKWRNHLEIGFTNLTQITDEQGWLAYIGKSIEDNTDLLTSYPHPVLQDQLTLT